MPFTPTSREYESYFDPNTWTGAQGKTIDAGRQFGGVSLGALLPDYIGQLKDIPQALDQQRFARSQLNMFNSPQGRAQKVTDYGRQASARAYESGKRMRAMFLANGQDIGGAANLAAENQAARATNDYAAMIESPQAIEQIANAVMKANSPEEVVSMLRVMFGLSEQDLPRFIAHLQDSASDRGGAFGKILGSLGNIVGMATGGFGGAGKALSLFGGGGGSDTASDTGQSMVSF